MRWNRKRSIFQITEIVCLSGWEFKADNGLYGVYVTRNWNWMNSYWMFWIGCLRGEQFLQFSKNDLSWFHRIFLLFEARKSCVIQIFLLRSIKAYLCPNIINFDCVDFSERRPEEVISFFWRSVYKDLNYMYVEEMHPPNRSELHVMWQDVLSCLQIHSDKTPQSYKSDVKGQS